MRAGGRSSATAVSTPASTTPKQGVRKHMDLAQATDLIRSSALAQHADVLIRNLALSARLQIEDAPKATHSDAVTSHFGGLPSLTTNIAWPRWDREAYLHSQVARLKDSFAKNPRGIVLRDVVARIQEELTHAVIPLAFLGQLELRELHSVAPLPGWPCEGTLAFFYSWPEQVWGFDPLSRGHCRVCYCPTTERTASLPAPDDLPKDARFPEHTVSFASEWTLPTSVDSDGVALSFWGNDDYYDLCLQIMNVEDEHCPIHRCGGHPQQIHGNMPLECQLVTSGLYYGGQSGCLDPRMPALARGAADWRLLLQIDSDTEQLGWMWGDVGRVYFWARQHDIARLDFAGAWALLQCY